MNPRIKPYGRHRVPRSHRRVMLVLLTGADQLSGYPISQAAMVGDGAVYLILGHLEELGWVTGKWDTHVRPGESGGRRRFYSLTPDGRSQVMNLLGLKEPATAVKEHR